MNKKQLNKFRMYEAVNLVLDTHPAMVGTEGDLFTALQLLKAGQATINQNRQVQEADSSGLTKKKQGSHQHLQGLHRQYRWHFQNPGQAAERAGRFADGTLPIQPAQLLQRLPECTERGGL